MKDIMVIRMDENSDISTPVDLNEEEVKRAKEGGFKEIHTQMDGYGPIELSEEEVKES